MKKVEISDYIDELKRNHAKYEEPKILEEWCKQNNIEYYLSEQYLDWYQLVPRIKMRQGIDHQAPTYDHNRVFIDICGNRIITHQPYKKSDRYRSKSEIEIWCKERGLSVEISESNSWYYPGETVLYVYRVADENKLKTYIQKFRCI